MWQDSSKPISKRDPFRRWTVYNENFRVALERFASRSAVYVSTVDFLLCASVILSSFFPYIVPEIFVHKTLQNQSSRAPAPQSRLLHYQWNPYLEIESSYAIPKFEFTKQDFEKIWKRFLIQSKGMNGGAVTPQHFRLQRAMVEVF